MIALLGFGLFAAAAFGAEPAPATQTTGPANDPNETICRRETRTGSRLGTRNICRTRAQWDDIDRELRQAMERAQNNIGTQCVPTPTMQC
jgi:hypothetical protein